MRILATAAFAFAAGVFSTQVLPEGGWLPLGLAALAAAVLPAQPGAKLIIVPDALQGRLGRVALALIL